MHSITIALKENPSVWTLLFNTKDAAEAAWVEVKNVNLVSMTDDFGQTLIVAPTSIAGAMLEDMEKSKLAHIARAIHSAKVNASANTQANADPMLRASLGRSGPPVLTSMNR